MTGREIRFVSIWAPLRVVVTELRAGAELLEQLIGMVLAHDLRDLGLGIVQVAVHAGAAGHTRTHMGMSPRSVRSLHSVHFSATPFGRTGTSLSP